MEEEKYVCPPAISVFLDNLIRKRVHNPFKIFSKYIHEGMTVIDLGCGPGFFTGAFAIMTGNTGKVIAADLQIEMLEIVNKKIKGKNYENRILFHQCGKENIGIDIKADFVNAFFMVHEVPSARNLIKEIYTILNKNGILFLAEPKIHVPKKNFNLTIEQAKKTGFKIIDSPKIHMSRAAVFIKE